MTLSLCTQRLHYTEVRGHTHWSRGYATMQCRQTVAPTRGYLTVTYMHGTLSYYEFIKNIGLIVALIQVVNEGSIKRTNEWQQRIPQLAHPLVGLERTTF